MEKTFEIEIEEVLQKIVKIKANSLNEAIGIAETRYSNQEYELNNNDLKETNFRKYEDNVIKQRQKTKKQMER